MFLKKLTRYMALATGDFAKIFKDFKVPSLPQVVNKVLEAVQQPDVSFEEVAKLIECDPGLTSQLLKLVNSAFCGLSREITNVKHAVSVLGIKEVETLVVSYGVLKIVKSPGVQGFRLTVFWTDSLMRALFAKELAKLMQLPSDESFLGALLQDIALPILLTEWFDVYQRAYQKWQGSGKRLSEIEEAELSWHHAQAGAWIAKTWKLPDLFTCAIGLHVSPAETIKKLNLHQTPVAWVSLSAEIPSILDDKPNLEPMLEKARVFGLEPALLLQAGKDAEQLFLDTAAGFGLSVEAPVSLSELMRAHLRSL